MTLLLAIIFSTIVFGGLSAWHIHEVHRLNRSAVGAKARAWDSLIADMHEYGLGAVDYGARREAAGWEEHAAKILRTERERSS